MAKGIALCVGLNSVDPNHYGGWSGPLNACEADANDMAAIADSQKFQIMKLLTAEATRDRVLAAIGRAAQTLEKGDIFMFSNSSHGGQLPDQNDEEPDGMDETLCLYDGELVDDELYFALSQFAAGVRVLVYSDSCHSGSAVKEALITSNTRTRAVPRLGSETPALVRAMPNEIALRTYQQNRAFYDAILQRAEVRNARENVKASVILISGCQDNQLSSDGTFNGLFTGTLRRVWNGGKFNGDYRDFHASIVELMPPDQTPNYFCVGTPSPEFEAQKPFSVNSAPPSSGKK